jgi:HlyD family secretion protein
MRGVLNREEDLSTQDVRLTLETMSADDSLFREKVISRQDVRDQKSKLLNKQIGIPQLQALVLSNENQQAAKDKDILDLDHAVLQQKIIFQQALLTLKSIVDEWKSRFIIKAPATGKVVFMTPIQERKYVRAGTTIGYINPPKGDYYAEVTLPQVNFGKIRSGQTVQLHFNAYPFEQFGFVEGRLTYISKISSDSGFLAFVDLPKGLVTTYGHQLQYRNGLKSEAVILTNELNLLQRIYYDIRKNFSH